MRRIYISGPIANQPDYRTTFNRMAIRLIAEDWEVENPAEIPGEITDPPELYLRKAIKMMMDCDAIVLLPGWERSRGAWTERRLAEDCGLAIFLSDEDGRIWRYPNATSLYSPQRKEPWYEEVIN